MKTVIKEYAGSVIALISTGLLLKVLGSLLLQKDGMLVHLMEWVLEGGV